jgi:hypothetical protein
VSRFINNRTNTTSFEKGVIEDLTVHHQHQLGSMDWCDKPKLINERSPTTELNDAIHEVFPHATYIKVASHAVSNASSTAAGDVVLVDTSGELSVGQLWWHARIDTQLYSCVSMWAAMPTRVAATYTQSFRKQTKPTIMELSLVLCAVPFLRSADGARVTVSMPPHYRR